MFKTLQNFETQKMDLLFDFPKEKERGENIDPLFLVVKVSPIIIQNRTSEDLHKNLSLTLCFLEKIVFNYNEILNNSFRCHYFVLDIFFVF